MDKNKGILIVGHGSPDKENELAFISLVFKLKKKNPDHNIYYGFLEKSKPSIQEAFHKMVKTGIMEVFVIPWFLFNGVHINHDIPYILKQLDKQNGEVKIYLGKPIGFCEEIIDLSEKLILNENMKYRMEDSCLLVAGIGSSLSEPNNVIGKLANILHARLEFKSTNYAYISHVTKPNVPEMLDKLRIKGYKTIVVHPVLFFSGFYLKQLANDIKPFHMQFNLKIIQTSSYGCHPLIIHVLERNIYDTMHYRINILDDIPDTIKQRKSY